MQRWLEQPDRNVIEEDMKKEEVQGLNGNRDKKKYPRSIKVLVTDRTNVETLDENHMRPGHRKIAE